jgi:type IV pilus assembly protein PilA
MMTTRYRTQGRAFTLIELMIVVAIVGILASLAVYGVRKYVANAKTAEATNSLGQIGKDASLAYEKESIAAGVLAAKTSTNIVRALCGSAGQTVPSAVTTVKGKKFQSNQAVGKDWYFDDANNKGFACLKFAMTAPQYYMYNYTSDGNSAASPPVVGTEFTATANGDLNGDNITSTFQMVGAISAAQLYVSPSIQATDPEE